MLKNTGLDSEERTGAHRSDRLKRVKEYVQRQSTFFI